MSLPHRSGFVNIIGNPNVGKSTLLNALVGEKMSIITSKPQTTRHRIFGILNGEDFQIVYSDSPGIIDSPAYGMQSAMNVFAYSSFEDADVLLFVIDPFENYNGTEKVFEFIEKLEEPKILVINKIDLCDEEKREALKVKWAELAKFDYVFEISALEKINLEPLFDTILNLLPEGPAYYPKDILSDKSERFFVSEIIREKILEQYRQEVPYSCEVVVERFKEREKNGKPLTEIYANIYVSRKTQKGILIGKNAEAIKKLGIEARKGIEEFLGNQVFLELNVRLKENWRDDDKMLKHFGYQA
ncbi:MAG TPA: GTPase Era [Saprospiraceae bacterium]|nr:GTPase Era [Saprospiraceae bacterium]